ncbi:malonyl-CoA decarboxylase domain-containing protein [Sphingomonas glacialis]|uniref:Malonyl-CoA decarboxylase C-terminal domain-containing protein n=1 Tax=Sphingomonas glacialis TaxID=658225 RepID=A0A502FQS3_9SPHN|nr:malonyl-CoA decarboxylase family protein [Sphingomonas glacialis]TPG51739.1 hypothetical protein EAH76_17180 [Sphingomonas glacialis]
MMLAARYMLTERDSRSALLDPVACFHIGKGARIDRCSWLGDTSARGMARYDGRMLNYAYDLPALEKKRDAYARQRSVAAAPAVRALLAAGSVLGRVSG